MTEPKPAHWKVGRHRLERQRPTSDDVVITIPPQRLLANGTGPKVVGLTKDADPSLIAKFVGGHWVVKRAGASREEVL